MSVEDLSTEKGYKTWKKKMNNMGGILDSDYDPYMMTLYKNYFQEQDPYNTKLSYEDKVAMVEAGWGDGSMDAVVDLVKMLTYAAPAMPFAVSGLTTLMNMPLFQAAMDVYFAATAPQMMVDFYENAKNIYEETEPGSWEMLSRIPGLAIDGLFAYMGISSGARILKGGAEAYKTVTGAARSEGELRAILINRLSSKGKIPTADYKSRMSSMKGFRDYEKWLENAPLADRD